MRTIFHCVPAVRKLVFHCTVRRA